VRIGKLRFDSKIASFINYEEGEA